MLTREQKIDDGLANTIFKIGNALAALDPGPLAELRCLDLDAPSAPMFWRLVTRLQLSPETKWARIIQIMAILTDKGRDENKASPHDRAYGLGAALCDGAEKDWGVGAEPRPMLSEIRFARLLASQDEMRADLMATTARMLARRKSRGVNCIDLAAFLLSGKPEPSQKLARDYYARLDRAQSEHVNSGEKQ